MTSFSHDLTAQLQREQLEACLIWQSGQLRYRFSEQDSTLSSLRPINSCTKSVVSLLCCIAMDKGLFPDPDDLAEHYFPPLKSLVPIGFKKPTIEHLLTLSVGFRWQEFGGIQSFPKMKRSDNWLSYLFQQPIVDVPGEKMCYNSGISQMLTTLLVQTTGQSVAQFAEDQLFKPLHITEYKWQVDKQGVHTGGFGLYMSPNDMLKIGILCVQNGSFDDKIVVKSDTLARATSPQLVAQPPAASGYYGWHWWIEHVKRDGREVSFYYARGYGGQFIFVVPTLELVVVTTKDQAIKGALPLEWFKQWLKDEVIG